MRVDMRLSCEREFTVQLSTLLEATKRRIHVARRIVLVHPSYPCRSYLLRIESAVRLGRWVAGGGGGAAIFGRFSRNRTLLNNASWKTLLLL